MSLAWDINLKTEHVERVFGIQSITFSTLTLVTTLTLLGIWIVAQVLQSKRVGHECRVQVVKDIKLRHV